MKKIEDILVIVQARLNSERVPQKMIKPFNDTTLVDIAIDKILSSKLIPKQNFYLSVYDKELIDIVNSKGINLYERTKESAYCDDTSKPMTVFYEWWDKLPFKYCILVSACNPFLEIDTIDSFIKSYMNSESDGFFAVTKKKNYFWDNNFNMITDWPKGQTLMNTKLIGNTYEAAHCLYASRMDKIGDGIWMGDFNKYGDIGLFPIKEEEAFDIDYLWQFEMAESYYKKKVNR